MPALGVPGTTTADMQRLIAAEYRTDGIVDKCQVSGTSSMSYRITAGAVIVNTGTDMAIKVPVAAQTVPTTAAPATGSRTDTIFVAQRFPTEANPDNSSYVGVTAGSPPPNSFVLDRRNVPAGITATTATTSVHNRKFAVPISGSLGRLHSSVDTNGMAHAAGVQFSRGHGRFYVPTDRDVEFTLSTVNSLADKNGVTPDQYWNASVLYQFYVDGQMVQSWEREISRIWAGQQFSFMYALAEGAHDVYYTAKGQYFPEPILPAYRFWSIRHGGSLKLSGNDFRVYDRGVINW